MNTYCCKTCNELHEGPSLGYGAKVPAAYNDVPYLDREAECSITEDQCIIYGKYFFILGNIFLPIVDRKETFNWAVWVTLSEDDFYRSSELWENPGRENEPPYFGLLSTTLPFYPETINLKTDIFTQPVGVRPTIVLRDHDHPLVEEQKKGITWDRVEEIASMLKHQKK
ncbi:MAG: DUF2199 domain-containing protein [Gammaproteobacteria bacterium]|nr:DUF2199 domain-containing protein [Gammaproteobacteria bacterium]